MVSAQGVNDHFSLLDCVLLPAPPQYDDPSQWTIRDRQGEVDLFYIISTETGDHVVNGDTCHYADTYDELLRSKMYKEMHAVDSFYSDRLNYYSPYYRQVSMQSWTSEQTAMSRLPVALSDTQRAWAYYLAHYNQGRPFILAGFSQGAHAMMDILKQMPDSIYRRMVAAYAIGYKVSQADIDRYSQIKPATGATDVGVTIGFNSVKSPDCAIPIVSGGNVVCINPVNWRTDEKPAQFVNRRRAKNDTLTCHVDTASRLLIVDGYQGKFVMSVIGRPGNYHYQELRFYYPYIRKNMADRAAAFLQREEE